MPPLIVVAMTGECELINRLAVLLAHLLEWQYQPARRSASWEITIVNQRRALAGEPAPTPR